MSRRYMTQLGESFFMPAFITSRWHVCVCVCAEQRNVGNVVSDIWSCAYSPSSPTQSSRCIFAPDRIMKRILSSPSNRTPALFFHLSRIRFIYSPCRRCLLFVVVNIKRLLIQCFSTKRSSCERRHAGYISIQMCVSRNRGVGIDSHAFVLSCPSMISNRVRNSVYVKAFAPHKDLQDSCHNITGILNLGLDNIHIVHEFIRQFTHYDNNN